MEVRIKRLWQRLQSRRRAPSAPPVQSTNIELLVASNEPLATVDAVGVSTGLAAGKRGGARHPAKLHTSNAQARCMCSTLMLPTRQRDGRTGDYRQRIGGFRARRG